MPIRPLLIATIIIGSLVLNCGFKKYRGSKYKVISYLQINVDSNGHLPRNPYVLTAENGKKRLVVAGVLHTGDTASPALAEIEHIFQSLQPEVIINEGGTLTKTYASRNEAIRDNGELGLEKYLADKAGIPTVNGDAPFAYEYKELAHAFGEEAAILQYASERFILPHKYSGGSPAGLDKVYEDFVQDYALKSGVQLSPVQRSFNYYLSAYKKYFGKDFSLADIDPSHFLALSDEHFMCRVTRRSKEIRDVYLLDKISEQLKTSDRILVVYGGWHVLAIEPALPGIVNSLR